MNDQDEDPEVKIAHDAPVDGTEPNDEETDNEEIDDISDYRYSRFPSLGQTFVAAAVIALLSLVLMKSSESTPTFAVMARTESAIWESGSLATAEGTRLAAGELILVQGRATLAFDAGAEVTLEAPARLTLVDARNALLTKGTAVAEVGPAVKGFTIRTPSARVSGSGTRFKVHVPLGSEATQTQVFDGLVEVALPDGGKKLELRAGQQNRVEGGSLGPVSAVSKETTGTLLEGDEEAVAQEKAP